jgi:quinol monooxygenase YgiN
MLFRILHVSVKPDRVDDWMRFTRATGFPSMLRQHGCRQIWRLRSHGSEGEYHVMTQWDSIEDLERFRASDDMKRLRAADAGLTEAARGETLYDVIEDSL